MNQKRINIQYEIILALLNQDMHGRALSKELGVSLSSIQRSLSLLDKDNIASWEEIGRNKMHFLKKNKVARVYVFMAENYKLIKLIRHYPYLGPIISDIIEKTKGCIILLFESYAKFSARNNSDIDVFIETNDIKLKKQIENINSRLSIQTGMFNKSSLLAKEIIRNHVIVQGMEEYYEKLGLFKENEIGGEGNTD